MEQNKQFDNKHIDNGKQLDLNGFITNSKESIKVSASEQKQINARMQKWRGMIPDIQQYLKDKKDNKKLKKRIRKGIPQAMRLKIWPMLAECDQIKKDKGVDFYKLQEAEEFPQMQVVEVDLPRTFPNHDLFKQQQNNSQMRNSNINSSIIRNTVQNSSVLNSDKQTNNISDVDEQLQIEENKKKELKEVQEQKNQNSVSQQQQSQLQEMTQSQIKELTLGQQSLHSILKALSLSFKEMGYCQGLNFVGASMLIYMNDEDAFMMLYSLMHKYNCLELYHNVASIHKYIYVFDGLLKKFLPKLQDKLEKIGIQSLYYVTPWFMTLYASVLPFNLFARVFDVFLYENHKVIYRVGLAMLKFKEDQLMKCKDMDKGMEIIKDYSQYSKIKEDDFIKTAVNFIFSKKLIQELEEEYNSQNVVSRTVTQY